MCKPDPNTGPTRPDPLAGRVGRVEGQKIRVGSGSGCGSKFRVGSGRFWLDFGCQNEKITVPIVVKMGQIFSGRIGSGQILKNRVGSGRARLKIGRVELGWVNFLTHESGRATKLRPVHTYGHASLALTFILLSLLVVRKPDPRSCSDTTRTKHGSCVRVLRSKFADRVVTDQKIDPNYGSELKKHERSAKSAKIYYIRRACVRILTHTGRVVRSKKILGRVGSKSC